MSVQKNCYRYAGTDLYEECAAEVQQANAVRLSAIGAGLRNASQQPGAETGFTAFLKSNYVQGTSRVCIYDRAGSPYIITIGAAQMCPISVP